MEMAQEQTIALANLATVTRSDRQVFTDLASTNTTLTAKLLKMQKTQGKMAAENAKLKIAAAQCKCGRNRHTPRFAPENLVPVGYCWPHGYTVTKTHNSKNFKRKR